MRVLLMAEAVTLAHVGRLLTLGRALHEHGAAVTLALCGSKSDWETPYPRLRLGGIGPEPFMRALAAGRPVIVGSALEEMIAEDTRVLRQLRPDLVIGDFRLSLSVSARLAGVVYAAVTNAYWSPACSMSLPMPVLPLSRWLPIPVANALFDTGKRFVLPMHTRAMNEARRRHGLNSLGSDIRRVYSDADWVLFADLPDLFPLEPLTPDQYFLGPVMWSTGTELPPWWAGAQRVKPSVYVNVGSSGNPAVLRSIVMALGSAGVTLLVSSAGSTAVDDLSGPNVYVASYLPGDQAAAASSLVVCNGGSMGCQQAFASGVPVLGIASNMDQFLNMAGVERAGAGLVMRADRLDAGRLRAAVRQLIEDPRFRAGAQALRRRMETMDAGSRLIELLPKLTAKTQAA